MKPATCYALAAAALLSWAASASAQDPPGLIEHTDKPITIDGLADEAAWADATEYANFMTSANTSPDNDDDLSAKWRALWDTENFYLFIEVTDDILMTEDTNEWTDDSVEIYLDGEGLGKGDAPVEQYNDGPNGFFGPNEDPIYQLTIIAGQDQIYNGTNHRRWVELHPDTELDDEDKAPHLGVTLKHDTGYTLEIAIPWASLGNVTPFDILDRGFFGFGIAVNDNDEGGTRAHQIMWATDSGELWNDPRVFPDVALAFPKGPGPDIYVKRNVDLGRLPASEATHAFDLDVRNLGLENALQITAVEVTGPDKDLVTLGELTSVPTNTVGKLPVTLQTSRTGAFDFTISITSNDKDPAETTQSSRIIASVINFAGPAIHYAMNDGAAATELRDITGYNRHGILDGAAFTAEGLAGGGSLSVSGGSQGVFPGSHLGTAGSFAISMWIQPAALTDIQTLVSHGLGSPTYAILLQGNDVAWFAGGTPEFSAPGVINAGTAYHVAASYNNAAGQRKAVLYVNGEPVASQDDPAPITLEPLDNHFIGAFNGALPFEGLIDDVQVYNRALNDEEAAFLFANPGQPWTGEVQVSPDADAVVLAADGASGFIAPEIPAGETGLKGSYWRLEPKAVLTTDDPMHRAGDGGANSGWVDENVYGTATTGTFVATAFRYEGNDLTPVKEWLGADGGSFQGTESDLDDGVFRFEGYYHASVPGNHSIQFTSDDGSVLYVGNQLVINNDNGHGNQDVAGKVFFPEAGYYPVDIRYFNGDWTNEAGDHGGANFIATGLDNIVQSVGDGPVDPTPDADAVVLGTDDTSGFVALESPTGGAGLRGSYWNLEPKAVLTTDDPMHRAGDGGANSGWVDENVYGTGKSGSFVATAFDYQGNDLTPVTEWLAADAASFKGAEGNLDDGVFRFQGYLHAAEAGNHSIQFTSDDGSVLYVANQLVINNDNGHGNQDVTGKIFFPEAGYYPVDIRYFNGDWTNEAGEHGGANFIATGLDSVLQWAGQAPQPEPGGDDPIPGLLGYWPLKGDASEVSGRGVNGTLFNPDNAWVEDATLGRTVYQSTNESHIALGALPALGADSNFTWSFWTQAEETANNDIVFGNRYMADGTDFSPREFIKFTPTKFEWHFEAAGQDVTNDDTALPLGEWSHNLVVKEGNALTYYRNGTVIGTNAITGSPANGQPLYLGGQPGGAGTVEGFAGRFAEVAIFDRALTAEDVTEVYARGLAGQSLGGGGGGPGETPLILGGVGISTNGVLQFSIPAGATVDIEHSSDLRTWDVIATGVSGMFEEADPARGAASEGYYRATQP